MSLIVKDKQKQLDKQTRSMYILLELERDFVRSMFVNCGDGDRGGKIPQNKQFFIRLEKLGFVIRLFTGCLNDDRRD